MPGHILNMCDQVWENRTSTKIHVLSMRESNPHALPKNTKHLAIDGGSAFTDGLLPMLLNYEDAFHGLYEVPNCS